MSETPDDRATDEVRIRRAPKIPVFLIMGGAVGAIATLILTSLQPADPDVGFGALFGYFLIFGIPAGVVLGAILALVLDRRATRRAGTALVERTSEHTTPEPAAPEALDESTARLTDDAERRDPDRDANPQKPE